MALLITHLIKQIIIEKKFPEIFKLDRITPKLKQGKTSIQNWIIPTTKQPMHNRENNRGILHITLRTILNKKQHNPQKPSWWKKRTQHNNSSKPDIHSIIDSQRKEQNCGIPNN